MKTFSVDIPVRFAHVDAAGIVFYPRYFEMINQVMEDWFASGLGADFRSLHVERQLGVPTVHLECDFPKPAKLADLLRFQLQVARIGESSFTVAIAGERGNTRCVTAEATLVFITLPALEATPIPADIRERMRPFLTETDAT